MENISVRLVVVKMKVLCKEINNIEQSRRVNLDFVS